MSVQKLKKTPVSNGRPLEVAPFFRSVRSLDGIGPKTAPLIEDLCGFHLKDLVFHIPTGVVDRNYSPPVSQAEQGRIGTFTVTIINHIPSVIRGKPYRVRCMDDYGGYLDLVFFHAKKPYLLKLLPLNEKRVVSGRIEMFQAIPQIVHPDHIAFEAEKDEVTGLEPTYPLTTGISQKILRKAIRNAIKEMPTLSEWQDKALLEREKWVDFATALKALHNPDNEDIIAPESPMRRRLAYDEILSAQLAMALTRQEGKGHKKGHETPVSTVLRKKLMSILPFDLTPSQRAGLNEIDADMAAPMQMLRLLQGDVGSGKTIVAFMAALNAIENGRQVAFMAPTEILARQHYESLMHFCESLGITSALLTAREKGKNRELLLSGLAAGNIHLIFGTHALFQDHVIFNDLAFVVIDEQHRFGVHQRMTLSQKGNRPDLLVMTATPIPRTLTLTAYGDLDVSRINEKPPGRKDIDTRLINLERLDSVIHGLKNKIEEGEQIYWVCPLVEESEKLDLAAAQDRYQLLIEIYGPDAVGLVHGKMKGEEKDAVMSRFKHGKLKILVATTVIEVGVNVPQATLMIIEHAERFGLSQLHQLRGRVGRSEKQSSCVLLYSPKIGIIAKQRLEVMRQSNDGFLIAEKDLELRGPGDLLGTQQSGLVDFKLANLSVHHDLIAMAHQEARVIVNKDPRLETPRGKALRALLYVFERDKDVPYLKAG